MSWDFRSYWTERARNQGESYVGPGGDPTRTSAQRHTFTPPLLNAVGYVDSLLDFGCGPGRFAGLLQHRTLRYVGCDIVRHVVKQCEAGPRAEFVWLEDDRLPFDDQSFEVVCAVTVLQHIEDAGHWCGEIRRVCADRVVVIDNDLLERPADHMFPRTPKRIGELLGMEIAEEGRASDNHWIAVYE